MTRVAWAPTPAVRECEMAFSATCQCPVSEVRHIFQPWGGRPRPRRTPWFGFSEALKAEADKGVGRGPGDRPTSGRIQRTSETGHYILLGLGRGNLSGDTASAVSQSDVLFVARPALDSVLPPRIASQVFTQHNALRKVSQSLRAGTILSSWIRILGPDRSPEFALEPVPTLLGYSRCACPPLPAIFGRLRLRVLFLLHS